MASDDSPTLKVLMIGSSGAGKSACKYVQVEVTLQTQLMMTIVLIRYCDDQFDAESSTATIGVDFKVHINSASQIAH